MGYPTKVQLIKRETSEQWYIGFPSAVARAMEFEPSEIVEWIIEDKSQLVLRRTSVPSSAIKKKRRQLSSSNSRGSGNKHAKPSVKNELGKGRKGSR